MRRGVTAVLAALALLPAGCGGDDEPAAKDPAQARAAICTARADITRQVAAIGALTPELASVPQVKDAITAITADIARIRAARSGLDDELAAAIEADARRLLRRSQLVTRATLSGGLSGDVRGALEPAVDDLQDEARSAFSRAGC